MTEKVGKWEFVVRKGDGSAVKCGNNLLWWGRGTSTETAKQHALERCAAVTGIGLDALRIHGGGTPVDMNAIEIRDGE